MTGGAKPGPAQTSPADKAGPLPGAKVLFIFVDSLRPDTVDDMVREGRLPNIKKLFYDQGLRFPNFFSTFPSLTINAFGDLLTGKWQSQSGLKAQTLFERYATRKKSFWKRIFFIPEHYPRDFDMLADFDTAPDILKQNKTKMLDNYLGEEYHPSVVPINPWGAPWAWPHVAANTVKHPYVVTTEAMETLDQINAQYALRYMLGDTRGRLFLIWFMELDNEQHRDDWGQLGEARKKMEAVDRWVGQLYDGLVRESKDRPVYVVLFSDHGSYGGEQGIYNQPYHISRDFFYQTLKMNVRGPDFTISHPGTDLNSFTYLDNMGRGQAQIFLPVGDSLSAKWDRPNTLYELRHYGLGPNRKPVDLIRELLDINLEERNHFPDKTDPHPVEFAFVKLSPDLIYVVRQGGAEALIQIERRDGTDWYRYLPVRGLEQSREGQLSYQETPDADPFGYLRDPKFHAPDAAGFIREYHNDQEWLEASYESSYPDAVTALVKFFTWAPRFSKEAGAKDPDLCLSAMPGWSFRIEDVNGADHGAITRDAMRAVLMISGPGIRSGIDPAPHRLVDVTPTLFEILGYSGKTDFDSVPIKGIYETR